ncbi:MAG: KH domain-containing protein [Actinobacteria bacterium]|nr:KH domain-containing protein [Actinomycetota bacterium]
MINEYIEEVGKDIEEATKRALERMNATRDQVLIEIIDDKTKENEGDEVRIRVTPVDLREKNAEEFINKMMESFKIKAEIVWEEKYDVPIMRLYGDEMGIIIGNKGKTLEAIQILMSIIANKNSLVKGKIYLDIEDYRKRKVKNLEQLSEKMAERAVETGEDVILEPMTASDRKVIHNFLSKNDEVITMSMGEEPERKVVITPVRKYDK